MDVLSDVLRVLRVRGALMATLDAAAPWGLDLPSRRGASFHAVVAGTCHFEIDGREPQILAPGDLVLLPTGARHALTSDGGVPLRRFDDRLKATLIGVDGELVIDGPGARTRILCAGYDYDQHVTHPLLGLLPAVLHVQTNQPTHGPGLRAVLQLLADEARAGAQSGSDAAILRLLEVLLVHVVRAWLHDGTDMGRHIDNSDAPTSSWLAALRDPLSARALALMHESPSRPWTLDTLARELHVSRATLARRFTSHVGEPPLSYLTKWRMELAATRLREADVSTAQIAREVGYTSEYAFNRAFSRTRGQPPGRYRRLHHLTTHLSPNGDVSVQAAAT